MIRAMSVACVTTISLFAALPAFAKTERCFAVPSTMTDEEFVKKATKIEEAGYVARDNLEPRKEKKSYVGVGFVLGVDMGGRVYVHDVLPGSPASKIEPSLGRGDVKGFTLLAVNGVSLPYHGADKTVLDITVEMLRGKGKMGSGVVVLLQPPIVGRPVERHLERERLTATVEKPYLCFEKKQSR